MKMNRTERKPTHPGIVLKKDVFSKMKESIPSLSKSMGLSVKLMSNVLKGKSPVTAKIAVQIGYLTNTSAESWLEMQMRYDLWVERKR